MRRLTAVVVAVVVMSLSLAAGVAQARTPAPTPTPTAASTPTVTPTPLPGLVARFTGSAWVDARPSPDDITAKIDGTVCGTAKQHMMADAPDYFELTVASAAMKPGCGREGVPITFLVGGRQVAQTFAWHAGTDTKVDLIAGPSFAYMGGRATRSCPLDARLLPYIGDVACGYIDPIDYLPPPCSDNTVFYSAVVYSQEQKPGCGTEGAEIAFKLLDGSGNVVAQAPEKGVWHAWNGTATTFEQLDLTMVPVSGVTIGSVGTGDSRGSDGPPIGVVLGLALGGVVAFVAGATLRKRAAKRTT